jgi:glycogen operon protein
LGVSVQDAFVFSAGLPEPLGATVSDAGVNFAVFSSVAESVELCILDRRHREKRFRLIRSGDVHHGFLAGAGPGLRYGFRVSGPWNPNDGLRCNPAKLLLDPYARAIAGEVRWGSAVYSHDRTHPLRRNEEDSANSMPWSVVDEGRFGWGDDRHPAIPWADTVIYETHTKGATARHPDVPPPLRGTYAGLAHPALIDHFRRMGVTAVELMPVQFFADDHFLATRSLRQYWGYQTIGFFSPHPLYAASTSPVDEFKAMVAAFHRAGLEVILDVVYNHTAEGNHEGPTLCFRGLDNAAYYRLDPQDRSRYRDFTGTGSTLAIAHPQVRRLVLDSLRYWVEEMHVDGFRFDLVVSLGRDEDAYSPAATFFQAVAADPVVSAVKLIAEPWDLGPSGYQVGGVPPGWSEWNGRYRDEMRDFWRGGGRDLDLARRLSGSPDIYPPDRGTTASINFITSHDGFTLTDLVSYDIKHNDGNGESNHDGDDHNRSWNSGVEGPTTDTATRARRDRRVRAMLTTLFCSRGVPMVLGGDELGRSQSGNNNAYCQDNHLSWYDWSDPTLVDLFSTLAELRRRQPALRAADHSPVEAKTVGPLVMVELADESHPLLVVANSTEAAAPHHLPPARWQRLFSSFPGGPEAEIGPWSVSLFGRPE